MSLLINISYAKTQQDSIEAYNKVKDWAVVKLTIAYMEDFKMWPPSSSENELSKSDSLEVKTYQELIERFDQYTDAIDLDEVDAMLSKGWEKTRKSVFKKYKLDLIDSVQNNNFNNVIFTPEGTGNSINREKALVQINKFYKSFLSGVELQENSINDKNEPFNSIDSTERKQESNLSSTLFYSLLAISISLNIVLVLKSFKTKKRINRKVDRGSRENYKGLEYINLELQNRIRSLENKNELLEKEVLKERTLQDPKNNELEGSEKEKSIEDQKAPIVEFEISKTLESEQKLIYFPSPFENNKFAIEDVSEIEKPTSLYVAEIDENLNKGIISLIETADLSRALNSPNTYLETACDYENSHSPTAKEIKVIKDGEIVLEGEDWVVKNKIRIKFI